MHHRGSLGSWLPGDLGEGMGKAGTSREESPALPPGWGEPQPRIPLSPGSQNTISSCTPALTFVDRALIRFSSIQLFWVYHLSPARTPAPNVFALLSNPARRGGKWGLRGWNI